MLFIVGNLLINKHKGCTTKEPGSKYYKCYMLKKNDDYYYMTAAG